jgi:hypothetical protein
MPELRGGIGGGALTVEQRRHGLAERMRRDPLEAGAAPVAATTSTTSSKSVGRGRPTCLTGTPVAGSMPSAMRVKVRAISAAP